MTDDEREIDFSIHEIDVEGVYISDDGYYTCEACDVVLDATGDVVKKDGDRKRGVFECGECGERYPC